MNGSCEGCPHLLAMTGVPNSECRSAEYFLCGFDPFDINLPGELIGFLPKTPEWCPLRPLEFSESFLDSIRIAEVFEIRL